MQGLLRAKGRIALAGIVLGLGVSLGVLHGWRSASSDTRSAVALVRAAADAMGRGADNELWALLAPETRAYFDASCEKLKESVRQQQEKGDDEHAQRVLRATAQNHLMPADTLLSASARDLWTSHLSRRFAGMADRRDMAGMQVKEVALLGDRATVEAMLPSGRPQGFHLLKEAGRWYLVDVQPFWSVERYPTFGSRSPPGRPPDSATGPKGRSSGER